MWFDADDGSDEAVAEDAAVGGADVAVLCAGHDFVALVDQLVADAHARSGDGAVGAEEVLSGLVEEAAGRVVLGHHAGGGGAVGEVAAVVGVPVVDDVGDEVGCGVGGGEAVRVGEERDGVAAVAVAEEVAGVSDVAHGCGGLSAVLVEVGDVVMVGVEQLAPEAASVDRAVLCGVADGSHAGSTSGDGSDELVVVAVGEGGGFVDDEDGVGSQRVVAGAELGDE